MAMELGGDMARRRVCPLRTADSAQLPPWIHHLGFLQYLINPSNQVNQSKTNKITINLSKNVIVKTTNFIVLIQK